VSGPGKRTWLSNAQPWVRITVLAAIVVIVGAVVSFTGYFTRGFQPTIASNCQLHDSISLVYAVYTVTPGQTLTAQSSFGSPIQSSYQVSESPHNMITIQSAPGAQPVCQFVKGH
jgi:hypothetical protein